MSENTNPGSPQVDVKKFRGLLLEQRERFREAVGLPTEEQRTGQTESETIGEASDYPDHPADLGSETFEIERAMSIKQNARVMLEQVEDALRKVEDGSYGICSNCHKPIPLGRLEAMPSAVYCVQCQSVMERR